MFLTITEDQSNEIIYQRELGDDESISCDYWAHRFALDHYECRICSDGDVPLGGGHFTVEIAEQPQTAVCWQAKSYFISGKT